MHSPIAPIFSIRVKFLNKFITILLAPAPILTTLLLSALNTFKAKSDNLVVFNNKVSGILILLKS